MPACIILESRVAVVCCSSSTLCFWCFRANSRASGDERRLSTSEFSILQREMVTARVRDKLMAKDQRPTLKSDTINSNTF